MPDDDVTVQDELEAKPAEGEPSEEEIEFAKLKEAISVQCEDIGTLRKKLMVTVPRAVIDERLADQYAELKREAQVAGFRRGRAPMRLIEKRFGRDVGDQLSGPLVGSSLLAAMEKEDIKERAIGDPRVWVKMPEERPREGGGTRTVLVDKLVEVDKAVDYLHLPEDEGLTVTAEVELRPVFDLPRLDGIALTRPKIEITDDMVEEQIRQLRAHRGAWVPMEGAAVEADDIVVADVKCTAGDQVLLEEPNVELPARDTVLAGMFVEGLGKALVGKKASQMASLETDVPDDFDKIELRGKKASFELTVQDVKRLQLPEIDEEFLEELGVESEDELRTTIRNELEITRTHRTQQHMRSQVRDHLLANTTLDVPQDLSHRQTDRAIARQMIEMYRMGIPQAEVEKRLDGLRAKAAEEAVSDLKFFFIMEKVADTLEVKITEEEVNSAIGSIARRSGKRFDRVRDELVRGGGLESLYVQLRDEKIMDRLIESADITETQESPKKSSGKSKKKQE